MVIYTTNAWKGYGKHNRYWNEYRLEGETIYKYKCHEYKFFDGKENTWNHEEHIDEYWQLNDPNMPEWLKNYL